MTAVNLHETLGHMFRSINECMSLVAWARHLRVALPYALLFAMPSAAIADLVRPPAPAEQRCIVPSKPGGGFELTCELLEHGLHAIHPGAPAPLREYRVGGLGRRTFNELADSRGLACDGTVAAFSSGSLLNLAQGLFGPRRSSDVRWIGALAADFGAYVVRADSPWYSLRDLARTARPKMPGLRYGGAGAPGSQDWFKAALLARAFGEAALAALDYRAYEGGGAQLRALERGEIDVAAGEVSEAMRRIHEGAPLRIVAVMAATRLDGIARQVPTAREHGFDLIWPVVRGLYACPGMSMSAYRWWVDAIERMHDAPEFIAARDAMGLAPFRISGEAFTRFVEQRVLEYQLLASEFGPGRH